MTEKTMRKVLKGKLTSWANSVEDKEIKSIIKNKAIITGGCLVSMMQNESPKDFDVYFKDFDSVEKIAQYYCKGTTAKVMTKDGIAVMKQEAFDEDTLEELDIVESRIDMSKDGKRVYLYIPSAGFWSAKGDTPSEPFEDVFDTDHVEETETDKKKYEPKYISANAITLSDKIQIVVRFYGEPDTIHETYDFVHTKAYYTSWDNTLEIPKEVYEAVMNKKLVYTGSRYPIASVIRAKKFIMRGWTINAGQYLKMAYQISKLDLDDIPTLYDQLVGVDSAFFMALIRVLQDQSIETNGGYEYISNLIDKIF